MSTTTEPSTERGGAWLLGPPSGGPIFTPERLTDEHQFDLLPGAGRVLDVGCGSAKTPGAVGIDISPDTDADIVHDLDRFPYPLEDASFDHVLMQDVLEHLNEPIRVLEELHRVLRPGGRLQR